jgi:hypothetical protein
LSILKFSFSVIFLFFFMGCAGEDGSPGPTGPQGETGPQGATGRTGPSGGTNVALIEQTFRTNDRNEENSSYYVDDPRINVDSVIGVYIKKFYTNTGDSYYTPLKSWSDSEFNTDFLLIQILQGRIRFFDPDNDLSQEIIVVAILN